MDKYLFWMVVVFFFIFFGWLYVNTYQVNECKNNMENYIEKIDSLEQHIGKLEYFIENQTKQVIVNVNNSKIQK